MLKVAIVNAVYPPEPVVSAYIGRDLALELAENGARVTVLCPFPTRPYGAVYGEKAQRKARVRGRNRESRGGKRCGIASGRRGDHALEVVRLDSFTAPESRLVSRMRESFSFGWHACRYLEQHLSDVDVIYANTWPLFSQALVARYCARRGIPLVLHIQDIYPESLLGRIPTIVRCIVSQYLTVLDRWTARHATRVIVISEHMRQTYLEGRGIAPENVVTVRNWVDECRFACLPSRGEACLRYRVPENKFTLLYLGNIGAAAGVELLIKAFHNARLKQAQLVIAGDGSARVACVALAERMGAADVLFVSDPDASNVPLLQSLAHVFLLPLRKGNGMTSVPSKLMAYLLSAKPVLATVDTESDTARCILESQCGWVGEPDNAQWLAGKMAEVSGISAEALVMIGMRGREYGLRHFSKAVRVKELGEVVENAVNGRKSDVRG